MLTDIETRAHALAILYLQQAAREGKLQLIPLTYANEYKRILSQMIEALRRP